MIGAHLALFVLLGQAPQPDPTTLVAQLGAPRYAVREAAADALERLGRDAIPALRAAHDVKDPEIRSRAATLLQKIEGALLTQPTLVKLDFENRPVTEVAKALSEQTGIKITLFPENMPIWQTLKITLREAAPVPFWKAMDRLCDEGHFYYNPAMQVMPGAREPVFQLYYGGARSSGPVSDQGPFRVTLLSLHYQHDVSFLQGGVRIAPFAPGMVPRAPVNPGRPGQPFARRLTPPAQPARPHGPNPVVTNQCYVQMQIAAEPRLSVSQDGPMKELEAVDENGQSLVLPRNNGPVQRHSAYFGLAQGPVVHVQAPLNYAPRPGSSIKKLRGVVPVAVTTRKPNPLAVNLNSAKGKTFQNDDVSLTVVDIKTMPGGHQTTIELTIRSLEPKGRSPVAQGAEFMYHRPDMHQQQIEVVDTLGRATNWYISSNDAEGSRLSLTLTPQDQNASPAQLRYYGLARASTEVSFEFADIPLE